MVRKPLFFGVKLEYPWKWCLLDAHHLLGAHRPLGALRLLVAQQLVL